MNNFTEVPNIISCKDLDYLSDMFQWNYISYKKTYNSIDKVEDEEIKQTLEEASNLFHDNMNQILQILGGSYE